MAELAGEFWEMLGKVKADNAWHDLSLDAVLGELKAKLKENDSVALEKFIFADNPLSSSLKEVEKNEWSLLLLELLTLASRTKLLKEQHVDNETARLELSLLGERVIYIRAQLEAAWALFCETMFGTQLEAGLPDFQRSVLRDNKSAMHSVLRHTKSQLAAAESLSVS